MSMKYWKC